MALQAEIIAVTPFRQNCTLLWDDETREAVLTDVGGDVSYLLQALDAKNLTLTAIWLTHGHLDHAGGVVELREHRPVPVIGPHADDDFLLQALPETTAQYGFPVSPAFEPTRWLTEGERSRSAATPSKSCTSPATRPATSFSTAPKQGCLLQATYCFTKP